MPTVSRSKWASGATVTSALAMAVVPKCPACVAVYFGFLLVVSTGRMTEFQALVHLLGFLFLYLAFRLSRSHFVVDRIMGEGRRSALVCAFVAGLTLEMYLVQYKVYRHPLVTNLPFPLNMALFWAALLPLAFALSKAAGALRQAGGRILRGSA